MPNHFFTIVRVCIGLVAWAAGAGLFFRGAASAQTGTDFAAARERMTREVVIAGGVRNPRVVEAMRVTPRHEFMPAMLWSKAYFDAALPIGDGQTISSPLIVSLMTEALDPQPGDKVLEIGTGSGYQAAVLSGLVKEVYTIEIVENLGRRAERALQRLKYDNVKVRVGDGYQGWKEHAPFDKIIVTCSPESAPAPLVEQLAEGGLMVIPVGERYRQTLYLMRKKEGKLESEALRPTLFVPMTGKAETIRTVLPDPLKPALVNGGFEEDPGDSAFVPGWYYQQGGELRGDGAPEGKRYFVFVNDTPSKPALMMQAFPIDGLKITRVDLAVWVKTTNVRSGEQAQEDAALALTFYDAQRKEVGFHTLGPFRGNRDWTRLTKTARVPATAREAIVRMGLFGATGEFALDAVEISAGRAP